MNIPYGYHAGEELDHLLRVTPLGVEKVKTIPDFLHGDGVLLRAVLQDELFQEQESPLMRDLLANLDERLPGVLRCELRTVRALTILDQILNLKHLLEYCGGEDLLLDGEGYAETFGVRLCPDEVRLGEADLVEALQLLQADREEFLRLR